MLNNESKTSDQTSSTKKVTFKEIVRCILIASAIPLLAKFISYSLDSLVMAVHFLPVGEEPSYRVIGMIVLGSGVSSIIIVAFITVRYVTPYILKHTR